MSSPTVRRAFLVIALIIVVAAVVFGLARARRRSGVTVINDTAITATVHTCYAGTLSVEPGHDVTFDPGDCVFSVETPNKCTLLSGKQQLGTEVHVGTLENTPWCHGDV